MVKKRECVKGSYTVEAAVVCPLICLILCGMIAVTVKLYNEAETYAEMIKKIEEIGKSVELIRIEAVVEELLREAEKNEGGV